MQIPQTRYVNRRGKQMAYQAFGAGLRTLVVCHEIIGHLDLLWTDPVWVQQAARLGRHCRVLSFQLMGIGLSDRLDRIPTLEEQTSDVEAVMDAEGIGSAVLVGTYSTAMPMVLMAAAPRARRRARPVGAGGTGRAALRSRGDGRLHARAGAGGSRRLG